MNYSSRMKTLSTLILLLFVGFACTKIEIEEEGSTVQKALPPHSGTLPNPYTLANMQAVYDSLSGSGITLQPTDLYVRFLPHDSVQLHNLIYHFHLELFHYPLDLDLGKEEVYKDPATPEGGFGWLYTTVKPDFMFPAGITHEILDRCYIPSHSDTIPNTRSGALLSLEVAAFERVGYTCDSPLYPRTRSGTITSGKIRVFDNSIKQFVPLQGVKIRCHTLVKWYTAYTNEDGVYAINNNFLIGPFYDIVFNNTKGFDIWGDFGPIGAANYCMGWHSKNGHSRDITDNNMAWQWAVVNNAGYEYYQMCDAIGINRPPSDLKIWVIKWMVKSAAPMFRYVNHRIGLNSNIDWLNFLVNISGGVIVNALFTMIKNILPDIVVGTYNASYRRIYRTTFHELSHASHFSQVGSAYWAEYINYIVTYGAYGDGKGNNAELCGVGEMWGYAMGHIRECEKYETKKLDSLYSANGWAKHWFKPDVFWDLYRNNILTKKEIYDCLTSDVNKYSKLIEKMKTFYPDVAYIIDTTFNHYGIK